MEISSFLIISSRLNITHSEYLIENKLLTTRYQIMLKPVVSGTVTRVVECVLQNFARCISMQDSAFLGVEALPLYHWGSYSPINSLLNLYGVFQLKYLGD
jgi:hypothetical protein